MSFGLFNLDFEEDLPALSCIDLFPNPPTQIYAPHQQYSTYTSMLNPDWDCSNKTTETKNHNTNMSANRKSKCARLRKQHLTKDKVTKTIALPTSSPSLSVTSNCSSAESLEDEGNATNLLRKKRKRFCHTCNTPFRKTRDFISHLRGHVTVPMVIVKKISEDNKYFQEYLLRNKTLSDSNSSEFSKQNLLQSKDGSLKLKLKISGSNNHNFHVVRDDKDVQPTKDYPTTEEEINEQKLIKEGIRILRADEIKQSKSPTPKSPITPSAQMLQNIQVPNPSSGEIKPVINSTESRYFECPTLDGLDQFNGEVSSEAAEDLLQKLLHCNQTVVNNQDTDWSTNSTPNEFISIDRLGHVCNICNANFVDNLQLCEHKQLSGHDCFNSISQPLGNTHFHQPRHPHPMHPINMHYSRGYTEGIRPPPSGYPHPTEIVRHNGIMYPHNEAQMHIHQIHMTHMQGFGNRQSPYIMSSQIHPPRHHQQNMISRRPPPPLYRVPGTQLMASRPAVPICEQQTLHNDGYSQNYPGDKGLAQSGQFLKTKMQKVGYSGVSSGQTSNSQVETQSAPLAMGQQTTIRPKFLSTPVGTIVPISRSQTSQVNLVSGPRITAPININRPIPGSQAPPLAKIQTPMHRAIGPASRFAVQGIKIIQNTQITKQLAPVQGNRIPGILGPREIRSPNIAKQSTSPQNNSPHPPPKKIKLDAPDNRNQSNRTDGFPVIKSVVGGAVKIHNQAGPKSMKPKDQQSESPIQLNEQITLCLKNRDAKKNPKEVASILATRGIIVTQKSAKHRETSEQTVPEKPTSATQEAVQKLQLNNSVSIISKKKTDEQTNTSETDSPSNSISDPFITCPIENCEEKFLSNEMLNRHTNRDHKFVSQKTISTTSSITATNGGNNVKAFKCKFCPALFSSTEGLQDHQWKTHKTTQTSADELGIPIIDLKNDEVKQKLAALGITNYIPLMCKTTNNCFGFPIVSVQGASNPNICNILGLGANSLLSLGPIKYIKKNNN